MDSEDKTFEEKYKIYDYINTSNDIEKIATYIVTLYPDLITRFHAKVAAKKILEKGITVETVLSGSFDKYIHNYIDDLKEMIDELLETFYITESDAIKILKELNKKYYFDKIDIKTDSMKKEIAKTYDLMPKEVYDESVKEEREAEEILLKAQKRKKNAKTVALILCSIGIVGIINYAYKEGKLKVDSKNTRKELTTIAGLDIKTGTFEEQSRVSSSDINVYDYSRMASYIINGCRKNPELFDYYMYDTYKSFISSKKNINPLMMMDSLVDELKVQLTSSVELTAIYEKINECDCFLDYLYKEGFIDRTDEDYYKLDEDIDRYKIIKLSGITNPLSDTYLPEESKARIRKMLDIFTSSKYDSTLLNEFKDDLDTILNENNGEGRGQ